MLCTRSTPVHWERHHPSQSCSRRNRALRASAGQDDRQDKPGIDQAWSDFVGSRERFTEPGPRANPGSRPNASPRYSQNKPSGTGRDKVSKQETELLDFFSQESFFAVGGGVVVLLLVVFLLLGA